MPHLAAQASGGAEPASTHPAGSASGRGPLLPGATPEAKVDASDDLRRMPLPAGQHRPSAEPVRHRRPVPERMIGRHPRHRRRKPLAALSGNPVVHRLPGHGGSSRDVGGAHERVGLDVDDDPASLLDIGDRRLQGLGEAGRLALEVQKEKSPLYRHGGVIAAGLEERVLEAVGRRPEEIKPSLQPHNTSSERSALMHLYEGHKAGNIRIENHQQSIAVHTV